MASVVERAFELASSGRCRSVTEVEYALTREGYELVNVHMRSSSLRKDLADIISRREGTNSDDSVIL
jgi:hypothetical protein